MTSKYLAGVDEVGRGCLAGPVVSAAIILKKSANKEKFVDSKSISSKKRNDLVSYILKHSHAVGIGICDNFEIDKLNIHNATLLSMKRAINNLNLEPGLVYIDGIHKPDISIKSECFIKGDQKIPEISAASIIAKVLRDNEMIILDSMLKVYGFANHKGYGTKEHMMAIDIFGPSIYHRLSFSPLNDRKFLNMNTQFTHLHLQYCLFT